MLPELEVAGSSPLGRMLSGMAQVPSVSLSACTSPTEQQYKYNTVKPQNSNHLHGGMELEVVLFLRPLNFENMQEQIVRCYWT